MTSKNLTIPKLIIAALMLVAAVSNASTVVAPINEKPAPVVAPVELKKAPRTQANLIDEYSIKYGVSASLMAKIIKCESGGNPNAVGDGGQSFGLVQIHRPSHPNISKAQALNPEFAISFLAKNLSLGKGNMWTCYRMIQNNEV